MAKKKSQILLDTDLQSHFFEQLSRLNKRSLSPACNEIIHYVSNVMAKYIRSDSYFELSDGKLQEKVLGIKLLESSRYSLPQQRDELKDVGDTALCLCGYFAESLGGSLLNLKYYQQIGQRAYAGLNNHLPEFYNIQDFFLRVSESIKTITTHLSCMATREEEQLIFHLLNRWNDRRDVASREALLRLGVWVDDSEDELAS